MPRRTGPDEGWSVRRPVHPWSLGTATGTLPPLLHDSADAGVATLRTDLAVPIAQIALFSPELGDLTARFDATTMVPREQITVPIVTTGVVSDVALFEDPVNPAQKCFLPRYRIAQEGLHYRISLTQGATDWTLTMHLEKYPASALSEVARDAREVDHAITVLLTFDLRIGATQGSRKELLFQEVTVEESGVRAVLRGTTLAERDLLYHVLTDVGYLATLTVRRVLRAAVSCGELGGEPLRPFLQFGATGPVVPPTALPGTTGPVRIFLQLDAAGRPAHVTPITVERFEPTQLYQEGTYVLDMRVEPEPFVFVPQLHGYIYQGITATSSTSAPVRRQVQWQETFFSYYQDRVQPYLFYYLPDCFKIARRPQTPHTPMITVHFSNQGTTPDETLVALEYVALPWINSDRLAAAALELRRYIDEPLPQGVSGLHFEPLLADPSSFVLALPQREGSPTLYQVRQAALVDLRSGIYDSLSLTLPEFQSLFEALFSDTALLFTGRVEIKLGEEPKEVIPFLARTHDLVGPLFDVSEEHDPATGTMRVTLQNSIESPLRIDRLEAELCSDTARVPAEVKPEGVLLPIELRPGERAVCTLTPTAPIDGSPLHAAFDLDRIIVVADPEAVWQAILDPTTHPEYARTITVKAVPDLFAPRPAQADQEIHVVIVDFENGDSVDLSSGVLASQARVRLPIADYILGRANNGMYRYKVTVLRKAGRSHDTDWRTDTADLLYPEIS